MATIFRRMAVVVALLPVTAVAGNFQDHGAIDTVVANAIGSGMTAVPVDRRIKLAACPAPLGVAPPVGGAVAVQCAPLGWRLRVLINGAATTAGTSPVIIKRGDPVSVNFVAPGFSVTTSGIAESDARVGERVRVRVEQKATPVMGQAVDTGSVRVGSLN